jgi:hypothetical protein
MVRMIGPPASLIELFLRVAQKRLAMQGNRIMGMRVMPSGATKLTRRD